VNVILTNDGTSQFSSFLIIYRISNFVEKVGIGMSVAIVITNTDITAKQEKTSYAQNRMEHNENRHSPAGVS